MSVLCMTGKPVLLLHRRAAVASVTVVQLVTIAGIAVQGCIGS